MNRRLLYGISGGQTAFVEGQVPQAWGLDHPLGRGASGTWRYG
ncbi:hypothetical protein I552_7450 [Mycobacterium xenopi 3993]|nr:hypothetical protein I552_7450 [Mycobacterium xenopi 3993]